MATTKRPSPVTKNAALAVLLLGIPRNVARASIVVASGVSTSSIGSGSSASGAGFAISAICWFSANPQASHRTSVSSP